MWRTMTAMYINWINVYKKTKKTDRDFSDFELDPVMVVVWGLIWVIEASMWWCVCHMKTFCLWRYRQCSQRHKATCQSNLLAWMVCKLYEHIGCGRWHNTIGAYSWLHQPHLLCGTNVLWQVIKATRLLITAQVVITDPLYTDPAI